jgi:hypothetical protein
MTKEEIENRILLGQFTVVGPLSGSGVFMSDDIPPPDYTIYEEPNKRTIKVKTRKRVVRT